MLDNQILSAGISIHPTNQILLNIDQITSGKQAFYEVAVTMKGLQVLPEIPEPLHQARSNGNSELSSSEPNFNRLLSPRL